MYFFCCCCCLDYGLIQNRLVIAIFEILQVMTSLSVPSTLVKCLYLFFDLPEMKDADVAEPGNEFTPRERRILLQKIFVQVCAQYWY